MNDVLLKRVDTPPSGWASLADQPTVLSAQLIVDGAGLSARFDGGDAVAIPDGRSIDIVSVDLSRIEISGTGSMVILARPPRTPRIR